MTEPIKTFNESSPTLLSEISEDLKAYMQYMERIGCANVPLSENSLKIMDHWCKGAAAETLETIRANLGTCRRCKLHKGRKRIVFGIGNPNAKLVLVGEGPGHDEDMQGEPFVGQAGQLLNRILRAIGLAREDVYICNIIKCRPPGNRNPEAEEIDACIPFLRRQLRAIKPNLICALGTFAAQTLLGNKTPISRLRGRIYTYEDIHLIPTYHPAFLLRNPSKKADVWEDMQKVQEMYEKA